MTDKNQRDSSKERIRKTAIKKFARKGYGTTGVRELADDADVNLAMINYFFGNKKGLLKTIIDEFFAGYIEIIESELLRDVPLDGKLERFIHRAVAYLDQYREHMIITMTELPHDDPDVTEHKASWAKRAMVAVDQGICAPIKEDRGVDIPPVVIGPLIIGMMSSRFLFAPVVEQLKPAGYGTDYFKAYPDIIATMFISGINGLIAKKEAAND